MKRKKSEGRRLLCTMLTATVVLSVFTVGILPASAQVATVTRALPDSVLPSETFGVTLTQSGFWMDVGTAWEVLPEGFEYVAGSYTGGGEADWNPATRTLKVQFFAQTIIGYSVIASSYDQIAVFSGTYKAFVNDPELEEGDVTGDTGVVVQTGDTTSPVISNVASSDITTTTATITWDTDEPSDSLVKYGTTQGGPYGMTVSDATDVFSHSVGLSVLTANTTYYYVVNSTDPSGNSAESGENSFTTSAPDTTAPVISNVASSGITTTTATITWDTDELSDSLVKYGTTQGGPYGMTASDATDVTSHSVGLSVLTANTTYYYVVNSTDPSGNSAESGENSFTTSAAPDTTAPVISNVASSGITTTTATITWDTDEVSDSLVKYGTTQGGSYTEQEYDAADVTSHTVGLSVLTANTTYYYVVNSTDPSGNSAESGENSFKTLEGGALPRWDINEDGEVDDLDLGLLLLHYGETTVPPYPRWDINEDGEVDDLDLGLLLLHYGEVY